MEGNKTSNCSGSIRGRSASTLIVDFDPEKIERFDFKAYIEGEPQEKKFLRIDMATSVNRKKSPSGHGHTLATFGSKEVIKLPLTQAQNEVIDRI